MPVIQVCLIDILRFFNFFFIFMFFYGLDFFLLKILQFACLFISELVPLLLAIAVITLIERRALGSIQRRRGPNENGTLGMFQPIADGIKLVLKELFSTSNSNAVLFMAAPLFTLFLTIFF